ncbi:MAG: hypothetical protein ABIO70_21040 [Pseudomonadota bacterium]
MLTSLLLALTAVTPAHAACEAPTTTLQVQTLVEQAEATYTALDVPGFQAATDAIVADLACLHEPVPRYLAASVHRMVGLRAFIDRQPERSTRAFAAARSIEPAYSFPETLVPAGNPVLSTYAAIPVESGGMAALTAPADGHYLLDGRPGTERSTAWPVIFQQVDGQGQVLATSYLWQGEPLPSLAVPAPVAEAPTAPAAQPPALLAAPAEPKGHPRWGLLATGGASLVAAGALYAVAHGAHDSYYDAGTNPADKPGLRTTTNTCFVGSIALGAAGLGLGTVAFVEVRW